MLITTKARPLLDLPSGSPDDLARQIPKGHADSTQFGLQLAAVGRAPFAPPHDYIESCKHIDVWVSKELTSDRLLQPGAIGLLRTCIYDAVECAIIVFNSAPTRIVTHK
jgi:hypothetical protein